MDPRVQEPAVGSEDGQRPHRPGCYKGHRGRCPSGLAASGWRRRRSRQYAYDFHGSRRCAGRQGQRRHHDHGSGAAIGATTAAARRVVFSSAGAADCSPRRKPWESARKRFRPGAQDVLARLFRPVPGLFGRSPFPKAYALGYDLSPYRAQRRRRSSVVIN